MAASNAFNFLVNGNKGDSQRPTQGSYMILLEPCSSRREHLTAQITAHLSVRAHTYGPRANRRCGPATPVWLDGLWRCDEKCNAQPQSSHSWLAI